MPTSSTLPELPTLTNRVTPWSDTPVFPLGPLQFQPGDDVLCLLCVSGGNLHTAHEALTTVHRVALLQGAHVWAQRYDTRLQGALCRVDEALLEQWAVATVGGGGTDLKGCLQATLDALSLPNGLRPAHLVLAFNGFAETLNAPVFDGLVLPTTVVVPPQTSDTEWATSRAIWAKTDNVAAIRIKNEWLGSLEVEMEQMCLGRFLDETLREHEARMGTPTPNEARPRPRL